MEIASIRAQLTEAMEVIGRIHERLVAASEEKSPTEKVEQAVQFTLRLGATLGDIGPRLQKIADKLSHAQGQVQDAKTGAQRWIHGVTIGVTLLILLMAAGQIALCRLSWTGLRSKDGPM
jgi:hypothetical protein